MAISDRREHLIDTAIRLFLANGFHATGIDTILKESGVSKKTLYRHFRSKEELILGALRKYDGQFRNGFMRQVEAAADTPYDRLLAMFDVAQDWFQQNAFYGCMFINAVGEYSAADTPIRQACKDFKKMMRGYIVGLCRELSVQDPEGAWRRDRDFARRRHRHGAGVAVAHSRRTGRENSRQDPYRSGDRRSSLGVRRNQRFPLKPSSSRNARRTVALLRSSSLAA